MTWAGITDADVWSAVLAGDETAAAEIFERHADRVYAHCVRLLPTRFDAEDAASVVLLEAWRKGTDVRFVDGSMLPWLLVVAINTARNLSRAQRRHRFHLARLPQTDDEPDIADDVAADVDARAVRSRTAAALANLSPHAQQVLTLCDMSGLSYADAAAALEIPIGTVRSRLSRARDDLRRQLAATGDPVTSACTRSGQETR